MSLLCMRSKFCLNFRKKGKKVRKKVLTRGGRSDIISKLSQRGAAGSLKIEQQRQQVWGNPNRKDSKILLKKRYSRSKRAEPRGSGNKLR